MNKLHENPKYLPGVPLGDNLVATPSLEEAVADADILVLCAPHQFMRGICQQLVGKVSGGSTGRGQQAGDATYCVNAFAVLPVQ